MKKSVVFRTFIFIASICGVLLPNPLAAQSKLLTVNVKKVGAPVPKHLFGFNLSDINNAFDGGLYAELIRNSSFEFEFPWTGWTPFGNVKIETSKPCFDQNPHYVHLNFANELLGCGLQNDGFDGIPLKSGETYRFSCYARTYGVCTMKLRVELVSPDNTIITSKELDIAGKTWVKYVTNITSPVNTAQARLRLTNRLKGAIDLDQISLFPTKTFQNQVRGLRADIAGAIADAGPQLLRFPGGNPIDRKNSVVHYPWKKSIGKSGNRPVTLNRWSYSLAEKFDPGYYQTFGFGLFEFLCLCEEVGAEPMLQIDCGLSLLNEKKSTKKISADDLLEYYKKDALDLLEFVNGDEASEWGEKRAEMGHSLPFQVKFITIADNPKTQADFQYLSSFVESIRQHHPKLELCGSAGVNPDARELDLRMELMKNCRLETIDEQIFRTPEWMLANASRYDSYNRDEAKIVIGEFAAIAEKPENSFETALSEAAFLTGVERNCDVVKYCAYAPSLARNNAWQCAPDLIWFDAFRVVKTSGYYIQQLFARNSGTHLLPATVHNRPLAGQDGLYASSVIDKTKNQIIVKVVNSSSQPQSFSIFIEGAKEPIEKATHIELTTNRPESDNTFENPTRIAPVEQTVSCQNDRLEVVLAAKSFHIFKINL